MREPLNWDWNSADFTDILPQSYRTSQRKRRNFAYIFIYIYAYQLPEFSVNQKSFTFTPAILYTSSQSSGGNEFIKENTLSF